MQRVYNFEWLINKFDRNEELKFVFFWGHTNKLHEEAGKFCFSQWYESPFVVDTVLYKTSEHWMMANKALLFDDVKIYRKIIAADKPGEAKALGREVLGFDDQLWNDTKMDIVINGNIHKFNQNPKFAAYLASTKDRILVEASPVDTVWGIGLSAEAEHIDNPYFWRGQNLLGFALMEVRDFLNKFSHFEALENMADLPWKAPPTIHPFDMFWRMGFGEDLVTKFSKYYTKLSDRDQTILKLTNPPPYDWRGFYDD